eukprot:403345286
MDQHKPSRLQKLNESKFIIIRHANSTFNLIWEKTTDEIQHGNETPEKYYEIIRDTNLLDCPLSDLGIQQCNDSVRLANALPDVRTVFVSPLRRALQTAYLLFKDHENFDRIKFIVHPMLRENTHTVCDIPESLDQVKLEYQEKIPHLDFSLIGSSLQDHQKKLWYFHDYQEPVRSLLLNRFANQSDTKNEKEIILEEIVKTYPGRLEDAQNTYNRRETFKRFLVEYQRLHGKSAGQICIVGHSQFFSHLTATEWPKKQLEEMPEDFRFDHSQHPIKFKWLQNCEFYPIDKYLESLLPLEASCSSKSTASSKSSSSVDQNEDMQNQTPNEEDMRREKCKLKHLNSDNGIHSLRKSSSISNLPQQQQIIQQQHQHSAPLDDSQE